MTSARDTVAIAPYAVLADEPAIRAAIDEIFFSSSNTKSFASAAERLNFRERWLGRYLERYPESCFVAIDGRGHAAGYICGSLRDPARDPSFADQPHFTAFADITPHYPAQLHVNVAANARGSGVGGLLIAAYVAHARASGVVGVHAISSRGARNLRFYLANGFPEVASARLGDKELVMMGRKLEDTATV